MTEGCSDNASFDVFPAIDILGGQCVRLREGDYAEATHYDTLPRAVAERWLAAGASWIHVVDLDGAKAGASVNGEAIAGVVRAASEVGAGVQVGGGIRSCQAIDSWLRRGVSRCILGTAVLDDAFVAEAVAEFGASRLIAGLDGRRGKLAVKGWTEQTDVDLTGVAKRLLRAGIETALVTDVQRDGTLAGANIAIAAGIQEASGMRCIASGGVRDLADVRAAKQAGLAGIIMGKALYDGQIDLREALTEAGGTRTC